ncbi:TPA: hypothetical protein ACH3X2_001145 [Trebouxia sp. C0005]
MLSATVVTRAVLVLPGYGAQRHIYQEGQRQRFLQEQYQRLAFHDATTAQLDIPHTADPEATDEALPEGEMPEYIQEEDEEEDLLYFVQPQQRSHGDIYLASSVGDTNRVRSLVEEEAVDVNLRDAWDAVPLYYACRSGHNDVAQYLLEAGAVCNEYTFDGDRCHYAALNLGLRTLLRQFEARPPPLSPLASSLRSLSSLCENPEATSSSGQTEPPYCDFAFVLGQDLMPLHRAMLAARSKFFRKMLLTQWSSPADGMRTVHLGSPALSAAALKAVLVFMYTERLDVGIEEVEPVLRLMRKCRLKHMVPCIQKERRTLRYHSKSLRKDEAGPRRFVLQPGMLPEEARLAYDLRCLRQRAAALEAAGATVSAADFADIILLIDSVSFRCHRCILAARSDYFRAFLERSPAQNISCIASCSESKWDTHVTTSNLQPAAAKAAPKQPAPQHSSRRCTETHQSASMGSNGRQDSTAASAGQVELPQLAVADVTPEVFRLVLEFMYSGSVQILAPQWLKASGAEQLFEAAERYLLPLLKREVAEHIVAALDAGGSSMDHLCRLLLAADTYQVSLLRNHCLAGLAQAFKSLHTHTAREQAIFEAFVDAVAPKARLSVADAIDILDGSSIGGASHGKIEGSGVGGLGIGTLLQDLRETFLEMFGGTGKHRDRAAKLFDAQLRDIATAGQSC